MAILRTVGAYGCSYPERLLRFYLYGDKATDD